jgi:RNA polymerase sigma-70 factor (ECF subfamily)
MLHARPAHNFQDAREFAAFIDEHYDRIYAFAWRVLGSKEDAEDLTQEICLALPSKIRSFRGDCKITTWLYRIVTNAAIDAMRKSKRAEEHAKENGAALTQMAEEGRERTRDHLWLVSAFSQLPPDLRVTASMLVEEGISQAEAAERLGVAPGTVAWRMAEIKRMLRAVAQEENHVA